MVTSVGMRKESGGTSCGETPLRLRLLGPLTVLRDGDAVALPGSRKLRALLAYLALAPHAVPRSQLCELLWELPNDPRGELRWCLSKLRSVVDTAARRRVETEGDAVALDLADCFVDATEIGRAAQHGMQLPQLRALSDLCGGEFLEGFEIDRNAGFNAWLTSQRRQFRSRHIALLELLAARETGDDVFPHLEKWLELAPFDLRVHENLLRAFARTARIRDGDEHLASTERLFESEGLDCKPIRDAWRAMKGHNREAGSGPAADHIVISAPDVPVPEDPVVASRRASIAVMPFGGRDADSQSQGGAADGLAYDIITRLAKLRSLFVIAQGTVFALNERRIGPEEAGRMLNVDYVVGGSLQRRGSRLSVSVELTETRSARVIWTEVFESKADDALLVLDEIGNRIVASVANEIEIVERNRAMLKPPNSLDAWEAHHRGLWHMYRFNKADNDRAQQFFQTAIRLDPTFARAWSGLSFTHFQNAFQGWTARAPEVERAFEAAGQSLMADDRDPGAHWAMGRALWLRGRQDQSLVELAQAVDLSPNFALGHYTLAFVHSQGGDPGAAVKFSDYSRQLSPFDPLLFGMLGARAMALVRLQRFDEAAEWGVKAASRPNAHAHIQAIAAYTCALAGRINEARAYMAAIRKAIPNYSVEDFLAAMQFDPEGAALFREGARRAG